MGGMRVEEMKKAVRMRHGRGRGNCGVASTSYGGMTRVRFGGCIPRVGKSRPHDREAPLSLAQHCAEDYGLSRRPPDPGNPTKPGSLSRIALEERAGLGGSEIRNGSKASNPNPSDFNQRS